MIVPESVKEAETLQTEEQNRTITTKKKQAYETLRSKYERLETEEDERNDNVVIAEKDSSSPSKETWSKLKTQGMIHIYTYIIEL